MEYYNIIIIVCHVPLTIKENEFILKEMRLVKPFLIFLYFILVNIGQIAAQSPETTEAAEPPVKPAAESLFHRIGIGLGYSFAGYREETDLPLNRYIDVLSFNMNGNIEKNNYYYTFNFGFLTGETDPIEIKNDENYFTYYQKVSIFIRTYFEHALDYRLWGNNVFPGYLGGSVRGDLYCSVLQESYYYNLTVLFSLNLHATQKWIIGGGKELVFSASIPFFGYAFRPPYYGLLYAPLDSDNRITSFHNYTAVFGDLKYHHKLSEMFSFYMGLGFELSNITFPQPRRDASISVNAGISFSF